MATIGLMLIQVYWIRDAVKVKQAVFFRDVNEAMSHVIFELDRIRFEERIIKQRQNYLQQRYLQQMHDSLNRVIYNSLQSIKSSGDLNFFIQQTNQANKALEQLSVRLLGSGISSGLLSKKDVDDEKLSVLTDTRVLYIE